jgi:hypothetical protein
MFAPEFNAFILVGGTALALQRGHRQSDDIDLFTDAFINEPQYIDGIRLVAGCWLLVFWLLVTGFWFLVTGCWLGAI